MLAVHDAVGKVRTERPEQRGWICHQSFHYNTPGSTVTLNATCQCGHTACGPTPSTYLPPPMGAGLIINPSVTISTAQLPATCFDVRITTSEDPGCNGWVCFFCKVYAARPAADHSGNTPLVCATCGRLEEWEVVFVKKVWVAPPNDGKGGIKVGRRKEKQGLSGN